MLTVCRVVTDLDSLGLILELLDNDDGTKDLFLGNLHLRSNISEDGRLDEVTLGTVALTTESNGGTLVLAMVDVLHDTVELELGDLRTLEGSRLEGVTKLVLSGTLLEAGNKLVVDTLLDQQAGTSAAALAVIVEDTEVSPRDGVVDIGIVEDNVGGLATQLKGDLLQVTLGSSLEDHTADKGGASESDLVNVHVAGDSGTGGATETGDDVDDTRREASLDNELGSIQTRQRSLLGSLDDDGVTGSDSGTDLPGPHENGEVPGDDLTADTNRLMAGVREGLVVLVDGLTDNLVGPATVVAEAASGVGDIALAQGDGLTVIDGLDSGQGLNITLEEVGKLDKHAATLRGSHIVPGTLEGSTGSLDGNVDILLGGLVDGSDDLFVGGVDGLEGLALNTLNKLVVNEPKVKKSAFVARIDGSSCRERRKGDVRGNEGDVQAQGLFVGDVGGLDGSRKRHSEEIKRVSQ